MISSTLDLMSRMRSRPRIHGAFKRNTSTDEPVSVESKVQPAAQAQAKSPSVEPPQIKKNQTNETPRFPTPAIERDLGKPRDLY